MLISTRPLASRGQIYTATRINVAHWFVLGVLMYASQSAYVEKRTHCDICKSFEIKQQNIRSSNSDKTETLSENNAPRNRKITTYQIGEIKANDVVALIWQSPQLGPHPKRKREKNPHTCRKINAAIDLQPFITAGRLWLSAGTQNKCFILCQSSTVETVELSRSV